LTPSELDRIFIQLAKCQSKIILPFIKLIAFTGLRRSEALSTIPHSDGYIFKNKFGDRYHDNSFLKPLKRAASKAGIRKRVDIHSLRHSWASNKIRAGWGIKKVSMILGHSDISLTSDVYTHLLDGDLKVRDDFRFDFDKNKNSANSEILEGSEKKAMAKIVSEFVQTIQTMPMEALLRPELAQSIQAIILQEMQSNAAKQQETTITKELSSHDPYMTRGKKTDREINTLLKNPSITQQEELSSENIGLTQNLMSLKFGAGEGARLPVDSLRKSPPATSRARLASESSAHSDILAPS
jgi:hypothetical protein